MQAGVQSAFAAPPGGGVCGDLGFLLAKAGSLPQQLGGPAAAARSSGWSSCSSAAAAASSARRATQTSTATAAAWALGACLAAALVKPGSRSRASSRRRRIRRTVRLLASRGGQEVSNLPVASDRQRQEQDGALASSSPPGNWLASSVQSFGKWCADGVANVVKNAGKVQILRAQGLITPYLAKEFGDGAVMGEVTESSTRVDSGTAVLTVAFPVTTQVGRQLQVRMESAIVPGGKMEIRRLWVGGQERSLGDLAALDEDTALKFGGQGASAAPTGLPSETATRKKKARKTKRVIDV
eukprot:TRINITY_DN124445_c0_g1_i1.p1 TRINITY_DN124445_c0_g1~~TRINITY_DN124445_c0_g1_i1.p1  ORF type:complete len:297 (+),score=68.83 TRINITY_DN124445_c0_g1_i1:94-984(+)